MSKTVVMFQGRHAFVDSYYSGGEWHAVKPWQDLETPIIAHSSTRQDKPNAVFMTRDVKVGPVYDETTCLMGYLVEEEVSFEEIESFAAFLGWPQAFGRRVIVFVGGTSPLRPALMTGAGLQPYSCGQDADFWEKRLIEKGLEGVWTAGKNAVVFDWGEVDDIPQGSRTRGRNER